VSGIERGFLFVDKPSGWTSHDVVAFIRRRAGTKAGHAGTLDPMATGLLVVALGRSTRLLRYLQQAEKEYVATARFGVATDTLDADGAVLSRSPMPVTESDVRRVMQRFRGTVMQVPPMVSAKKVDGRRLYELAREGKEVERAARPVTIAELELLDFSPCDYPEVTFRTVVGSGTYVRSLADDMARALGGRAHLTALRRTRVGVIDVTDAVTVEEIDEAAASDAFERLVVAPAAALRDLPSAAVAPELVTAAVHGASVPVRAVVGEVEEGRPVVLTDGGGRMLGVFRVDRGALRPEVVTA